METSCFKCKAPAVFYQRYSGRHLCTADLKEDAMIRVRRTIRKQGGLGRKKVIGLFWKGDFRYLLLYCIGELITGRKDMIILLLEDEQNSLEISDFSKFMPPSVKIKVIKIFNDEIEEIILKAGGDRLFSASYLEDEASQILSYIFSGDSSGLIQPVLTAGIKHIKPFREIPGEELVLSCIYTGLSSEEYSRNMNNPTKSFLNKLSEKHPSVPFSLIRYEDRLREIERTIP
jgi:hypothetical protein